MSHIYLTIHQSNRTQKRNPENLAVFLRVQLKLLSPPANFGLSIQGRAAGYIDKADHSAAGRDQPWKCLQHHHAKSIQKACSK